MSFTTAGGDVIAIKNIEELFIKVSSYSYNLYMVGPLIRSTTVTLL